MRSQVVGLCRTYPRSFLLSGLVILAAVATVLATPDGSSAELSGPGAGDRRVTLSVATLLQRLHLAREPLDDEKSKRCLDNFLKALDPLKSHFRQSDIEEFARHETSIDDEVRLGDVSLAYTIFKRFLARVEERNKMIEQILDSDIDFSTEEKLVTDRDALT
ncbi:MAG: hypothetical protein KDA42_05915, partial [Planctomycetales bacterium]|nr:hypothetical protein [Planctomycetales bacterium]